MRCRARCVIIDGKIKALTGGDHNHAAHTEKIEKILRRNQMIEMVPTQMTFISTTKTKDPTTAASTTTTTSDNNYFLPKYGYDEDDDNVIIC